MYLIKLRYNLSQTTLSTIKADQFMLALLFYRIIFLLLLPVLLLALIIRSIRNPQYRQRLSERLGFFPNPSSVNKNGIVIHAASVGEVIALSPLIEQLLQKYQHLPIIITTFTPTGSAQVKKLFGQRVHHALLPLDVYPCTYLFLSRLKPQMMIFMETELWPNLISQCSKSNIKLLLINGRLSAKSMKSYQKISALIKPSLHHFDKILCQSNDNLDNFLRLGASPDRCQVTGNLKFDISINEQIRRKQVDLQKLPQKKRPIWIVASTHQGDEEIALQAYSVITAIFPQLLLVIVPRHPERFSTVNKFCISQGYSTAKRSENTPVEDQNIWLIDTLGELMAVYSLADIVTMGGSFSDIGGHNPLEPALFKKPIIVGNDMKNFTDVLKQLQKNDGIIQLPSLEKNVAQALAEQVINLLKNPKSADLLGGNAHQVVLNNQGATQLTLAQIQELI